MLKVVNTRILRDNEIEDSLPSISTLLTCSSDSDRTEISRELAALSPHVDEIVLNVVGEDPIDLPSWHNLSTDGIPTVVVDLNARDFPHLYFRDLAISYQAVEPLAGEAINWRPSGTQIVADWSCIRELCQLACSQDFILHLRHGEILADPERLRGACLLLTEHGRSHAASLHLEPGRSSILPLLTNRRSHLHWTRRIREQVTSSSMAFFEGSLATTSCITNSEMELKTLYIYSRTHHWNVPDETMLHLARSASLCGEGKFAAACIDVALARSRDPEIRAWASCLKGESQISLDRSSEWYERSLLEYPTSKAALRLCRTMFHARRWQECSEAYVLATSLHDQNLSLLDDSPLELRSSLLLATAALAKLGRSEEAARNCQLLMDTFPNNQKVKELCRSIG